MAVVIIRDNNDFNGPECTNSTIPGIAPPKLTAFCFCICFLNTIVVILCDAVNIITYMMAIMTMEIERSHGGGKARRLGSGGNIIFVLERFLIATDQSCQFLSLLYISLSHKFYYYFVNYQTGTSTRDCLSFLNTCRSGRKLTPFLSSVR